MNKVSFSKTLFVQHFCIMDKPKKIPQVDFWRGGWFMKWLDGYLVMNGVGRISRGACVIFLNH